MSEIVPRRVNKVPGGSSSNHSQAQRKLTTAHRYIMEAGEGPSMALIKGKASRSALDRSARKLRMALSLIEEVIDA